MRSEISPHARFVAGFALLILLGAGLLLLPPMTREGIGVLDALFTSCSAVCVTGLAVVDTGTHFTRLGQLVILLLIQTGGLGIMTFSSVIFMILRRGVPLHTESQVEGAFVQSPVGYLYSLVPHIFLFTFLLEAAGAAIYYARFQATMDKGPALFYAVFHSVSAFCNAGFALFPDSFVGYRTDFLFNLNSMFLIIAGGMGFLVMYELWRKKVVDGLVRKRGRSMLTLHSRTVLQTTAALIILGAVLIFLLDFIHALRFHDIPGQLLASFFQSVTARTAGFNTMDMAHMSNAALFFMMLLMFVGASPGSCGGGVKTTSAAVLFAVVRSHIQGKKHTNLHHRTLPDGVVSKAMAVIVASACFVALGALALMITQLGDTAHVDSRGYFLEYLFEAVSAFATAGLSMGVTSGLNAAGKAIVITLMFVGRLGPLTVVLLFRPRHTRQSFVYGQESVMVG